MPAFPPLCLAFGYFLVNSRISLMTLRAGGIAAFIVLALLHHGFTPWYAAYRSPVRRPEEVCRLCGDKSTTVVCYSRNCDSAAFYLGRDDLRCFRSKEIDGLRTLVRLRPRTVILCTHRHSLRGLHQLLPPDVRIVEEVHYGLENIHGVPPRLMKVLVQLMGETALGLCDIAVVEPGWAHPNKQSVSDASQKRSTTLLQSVANQTGQADAPPAELASWDDQEPDTPAP
jgi:hypothetical protein